MFKELLEGMARRVEGTLAVSIIGLDGIAVASVGDESLPLEPLGAEVGAFVKSLRSANTDLNTGDVQQFSMVTDKYITFLSGVTSDYFVLMVLSRDGNYGRARFELLKAKHVLKDELI
ncbi:MAG: roadblock/LC7 domain-containing protein [Thermoanaerobaculia bacterium]